MRIYIFEKSRSVQRVVLSGSVAYEIMILAMEAKAEYSLIKNMKY